MKLIKSACNPILEFFHYYLFSFRVPNRSILRPSSYITYIIFYWVNFFMKYLLSWIWNLFFYLYRVEIGTNRFVFHKVLNSFKLLFVFFAPIDLRNNAANRLIMFPNVYVYRERFFPRIHRLWVLFYRSQSGCHDELNVNARYQPAIDNFYYRTRIQHKQTVRIYGRSKKYRLNPVVFYFFNKIALVNYPNYYWTYNTMYNRYSKKKKSSHIRTHLFFMFLEFLFTFLNETSKRSFIKTSFFTFKGFWNLMQFVDIKRIKPLLSIFTPKTKKIHKLINYDVNLAVPAWANYMRGISIKVGLTFYKNIIILTNSIKRQNSVYKLELVESISRETNLLPLTWFNKLHNSVVSPVSSTVIMYIRSARHFNKGRYSRNRQIYRTGVYWCIWLNVLIVYGLQYYFYRMVFSFGYLWIPIGILILSIFFSRIYKYRFYNINQIKIEFYEYFNFLYDIFENCIIIYWRGRKIITIFTRRYVWGAIGIYNGVYERRKQQFYDFLKSLFKK